jgi:outer membrane protein TolC
MLRHKIIFLSLALQILLLPAVSAQTQPLSLKEAIALAVKNNRSLKVSQLDISRAEQQTNIAKSRALPSVNLTSQYLHYFDQPVFFGLGNGTPTNDKIPYSRFGGDDQFTAAVTLVHPLYNPAVKPAIKQAYLTEKTNRLIYGDKEINVVAQVKQLYIGILVLNERLKLVHESLNRNEVALKDARSLYMQGRALRVDTLRAYTTVKNLQPDILRISNAINTGKLQLLTLLGIDSAQELNFTDSLVTNVPGILPSEEEVYAEAKTTRPDLQALSLQQQINEQQIEVAKAGRLPVLSLVGQYQLQTQTNKFRFGSAYWPLTSFAGAQLTIPIFNGNSNNAKIKEARLATQQSVIQLTDAQQQLKTEVRRVVSDLQETAERMKTQLNVKETAQLSYDIVQYRYAKGVTSRLELTDAELALTTAQSNYLEAVFDYLSANIQLDRVIGKTGN